MSLLKSIFGRKRARRAARIQRQINAFEPSLCPLSDEDLQVRSRKLRELARGVPPIFSWIFSDLFDVDPIQA